MHIPGDSLDPWVAGLFWFGSNTVIGIAVRRIRGEFGDKRTPLLGVVAAGIFAAQVLNWSIPSGTSAHFVGRVFAGILLGLCLGVLTMSIVVMIRTLVFGDGGTITFGANLFAMTAADVLIGYALFRVLRGIHEIGAAPVAGWGVITVSALIVGIGIGFSSALAYELSVTVLIMAVGHTLLGFVEGVITAVVYGYVADARLDLVLG